MATSIAAGKVADSRVLPVGTLGIVPLVPSSFTQPCRTPAWALWKHTRLESHARGAVRRCRPTLLQREVHWRGHRDLHHDWPRRAQRAGRDRADRLARD